MKIKSVISLVLVIAMVLTLSLGLAACSDGTDGITPQLRINSESNDWEVSYDNGATWTSMGVKATGADGISGINGADAVTPVIQINAETNCWEVSYDNGTTWTSLNVKATGADGANGKDGANGANGADGSNGKDGVNGTDGSNGDTPYIGDDGYWYIGSTCTNIYAGSAEKVTVTYVGLYGETDVSVPKGSKASYYVPESSIASFVNWYADEDCTEVFDFNAVITESTTIYSKWEFEQTFLTVGELMKNTSFGSASCFGTTNCFNSVYIRVLTDDHSYYNGAAGIANYLKNVFIRDEDNSVIVNPSSSLRSISYTDAMTVINFASAFSSYQQYVLRNSMEMDADIAAQKDLAVEFFNTVDASAEDYHTHSGGGLTFPSMAVAVVALGSLMEQQNTERFETLIKDAYENVDAAFWNPAMYLTPFYQLCAHYDWYDNSENEAAVAALETLTDANVLTYYAYGIDLANDYPELWNAYVENALSDGALSAAEAKAFGYHYAYQLTGGDIWLGVYGSSYGIVDFG